MIDKWLPVRDSTGAIRKLPVRVVPPQNGLNGTTPHTSAFRDNPVNVSNQAVGEEDISILRHINGYRGHRYSVGRRDLLAPWPPTQNGSCLVYAPDIMCQSSTNRVR